MVDFRAAPAWARSGQGAALLTILLSAVESAGCARPGRMIVAD
jgi:hypothetical protein